MLRIVCSKDIYGVLSAIVELWGLLFYRLGVTNNSDRHLFPYLVYFNPSD